MSGLWKHLDGVESFVVTIAGPQGVLSAKVPRTASAWRVEISADYPDRYEVSNLQTISFPFPDREMHFHVFGVSLGEDRPWMVWGTLAQSLKSDQDTQPVMGPRCLVIEDEIPLDEGDLWPEFRV